MKRWTEASVRHLMVRAVGPSGQVSRTQVPIAARVQTKAPRYTAKREKFDGIWFASQAELRRYKDLKLLEDGGAITGLKVHPRYDLHASEALLGYVELDFEYLDCTTYKTVYEDVKDPKKNTSTRTPIYRWKARHLRAEHGIDITEVSG